MIAASRVPTVRRGIITAGELDRCAVIALDMDRRTAVKRSATRPGPLNNRSSPMSANRPLNAERVVSRDPEVLSGKLVFAGTRVPVQTLIDYLKAGETLDRFLDGFPTVEREQAEAYLEMTLKDAETHA